MLYSTNKGNNLSSTSMDNYYDQMKNKGAFIQEKKGLSNDSSVDKLEQKFMGNQMDFNGNTILNNNNSLDDMNNTNGGDSGSLSNLGVKSQHSSIEKTLRTNICHADNLSTDLCTGLDDIINALTKQNDSINLHKIAQSILELQKKSHNLNKVIKDSSITTTNDSKSVISPIDLNPNSNNVLQNNRNLINICTFGSNVNEYGEYDTKEDSMMYSTKNNNKDEYNYESNFGTEENCFNNKENLVMKRANSDFVPDKEKALVNKISDPKAQNNGNNSGNNQFINSYFLRDKNKIR